MSEDEFSALLRGTIADYRKCIAHRDDVLFTEFLPKGYRMMTLSCVPDVHYFRALFIKCNLGMFITLIDDFADNPKLRNRELLDQLYRVPFDDEFMQLGECSALEREICYLALRFRSNMKEHIRKLPGFLPLYDVFKFDFEEVMRANRYSELITDVPDIANPYECRHYGAFNMGMVLAGLIDLMCLEKRSDPLGAFRSVFLLGQRHGRLSNLIATLGRESVENDVTNEFVALANYHGTSVSEQRAGAESEMQEIEEELSGRHLNQFDLTQYTGGLRALYQLHLSLSGKI